MILWLAWTDLFDTCRPYSSFQSSNGNTRGTGDISIGSTGSIGRACARVDAGALGMSVQASTCYTYMIPGSSETVVLVVVVVVMVVVVTEVRFARNKVRAASAGSPRFGPAAAG